MRVGDSNADMTIFGAALDEFLYKVADILLMLKYVRRPDQLELIDPALKEYYAAA